MGVPDMSNPLLGILATLGGQKPNLPQPATAAPPAQPPPDPTQDMMSQAQQSMDNPMAQAVPSMGGLQGLAQHPVVQQLIQGIAKAAQGYGWTGSSPQERLERTQMEQQKAETMARMAQTGAYQSGELANRQAMTTIAGQNADTKAKNEASQEQQRKTMADIAQQKQDLATEANEWKKDLAAGRLSQAKQRLDNQASQFEQTIKIRAQQVGIEQAKLELAQTGMGIKQGFLDLANTALSQKGTAEGLQAIQQIQNLSFEHPILGQLFGLDDVAKRVSDAASAGVPGTAPTGKAPSVGGPTAPLPQPPATNKVQAKQNQKAPKAAGPQLHYDAQGNRIAGPN
jgi:hypothetical protein